MRRREFKPVSRIDGLVPYRPSEMGGANAWRLHANEGTSPLTQAALERAWDHLQAERYPSTAQLESQLAHEHGIEPDQIVVTAGLDDGLCRLAWALLEPGRRAVVTHPTFEMIPRYVQLAGGVSTRVPWLDEPFPEQRFVEALQQPDTTVGFVCTPSSPAGEVMDEAVAHRVAEAAASLGRLLVIDLAYGEFADVDLTPSLLARGDVCVARTFSKAVGLAGLRLGYVMGPPQVIDWLRTVGQPFAVSIASLAIAQEVVEARGDIVRVSTQRVREERAQLWAAFSAMGAHPIRSQGNFVLGRMGSRGPAFVERLAVDGYRVRLISIPGTLEGAVRITCPQNADLMPGLLSAIEKAGARD